MRFIFFAQAMRQIYTRLRERVWVECSVDFDIYFPLGHYEREEDIILDRNCMLTKSPQKNDFNPEDKIRSEPKKGFGRHLKVLIQFYLSIYK